MFALIALVYFLIGSILAWNGSIEPAHLWADLFIGLAILSAHFVWAWTPWTRRAVPPTP